MLPSVRRFPFLLIAAAFAILPFVFGGATVAVVAESPAPPGFSVEGKWSYGSLEGHLPGKPTIWSNDPAAVARWNPQIKSPGKVRFSLFVPSHPSNDPAACVDVIHGGKIDHARLDQTQPAGWIVIGEFDFAGRGEEYVRLTHGTKGKNLRAAAAKFEFVNPAADNLWANLVMDDVHLYDLNALAPKPVPFTDIQGHWAERQIRAAAGGGWVGGVAPTRFGPDEPVASPVCRAAVENLLERAPNAKPALAAFSLPEANVTPQSLASAFVAAARATGKNLDWARPMDRSPIGEAIGLNLVTAADRARFDSTTSPATRAHLALLLRAFQQQILLSGPPVTARWELTFDDEFNGNDLDWNVWQSANGESWGKLLSVRYKENVAVGDGIMRLITRKENRGGKQWTSAFVSTKTFRQQYGYWEARYRYAAASGLNNAFWTNPDKTYEIDVNEGHYPNVVNSTLHQQDLPSSTTRFLSTEDLSADFHVYAVDWNAKEIIYYVDGKEIGRKPNVKAHKPGPVMFSTAVFGSWTGPLTDALDGKSMDVDWVRIYRLSGEDK